MTDLEYDGYLNRVIGLMKNSNRSLSEQQEMIGLIKTISEYDNAQPNSEPPATPEEVVAHLREDGYL